MTEIYALTIKETGEVLHPDSFKKYWKGYGGNSLQGWRPPKKMYYTIGHAKTGFSHIPDEIKPHINITKFIPAETVVDGEKLYKEQEERRVEKEKEKKRRRLDWEKERAETKFREALEELSKLDEMEKDKK